MPPFVLLKKGHRSMRDAEARLTLTLMRLMITVPIGLLMSVVLSASALTADNPEAVVRAFMRAAYSNDTARFNSLILPRNGAGVLLADEQHPKSRLEEIEAAANTLQLKQVQPFRQRGRAISPGPAGSYPDSTTTRYMTSFLGNLTVISVVKKAGRWLVDVRWWLKMREMSLREEKARLDEKELVIRTFLMNLLRLNRRGVSKSLVPGADLDVVFEGAPQVPEPSDQLYALALEMPLVEAEADEVYPLPSGKLVKGGAMGNISIMVGLYGTSEMVLQLQRLKGAWRIVPEAYYPLINR